MTRLTELRGVLAESAAVRWDRQSLDVLSVVQTARTQRADFIADQLSRGLAAFSRWLGLAGLMSSFRRYTQRCRTLHQLSALDDRMLNDIGVHRADIQATAAFCCEESPAAGNSVWYGLGAWASREARRRRTQRELSAMSDELLADIGIARSEIPAVAAALAEDRIEDASAASGPAASGAPGSATSLEGVTAQMLDFEKLHQNLRRASNDIRNQSSAA